MTKTELIELIKNIRIRMEHENVTEQGVSETEILLWTYEYNFFKCQY